ncbi:MAG: hypothetical protein RIT14_1856 [Pseudomonadota bacterium]|jgi:predicted DsbA family dithiol-disulfide isomerase
MRIDAYFDVIDPWSFIGKVTLQEALGEMPDAEVVLDWHPMQMLPEILASGIPRSELLKHQFESPDEAERSLEPVKQAATQAGLQMNWTAIQRVPNTLNAHRIIFWAREVGLQDTVIDAFFHAYFYHGEDLTDISRLIDLAVAAGMDRAMVEERFHSDQDVHLVKLLTKHARDIGVKTGATFVIDGKSVLHRPASKAIWLKVLAEEGLGVGT